jgi:hypothetical protein
MHWVLVCGLKFILASIYAIKRKAVTSCCSFQEIHLFLVLFFSLILRSGVTMQCVFLVIGLLYMHCAESLCYTGIVLLLTGTGVQRTHVYNKALFLGQNWRRGWILS